MVLDFPTLETLTLALRAGSVPAALAAAPVKAWTSKEGRLLAVVEGELSASARKELRRWGIAARAKAPKPNGEVQYVTCLMELVPLVCKKQSQHVSDRLPVIFWLKDSAQLAPLVREVLRQNNDRIALRSLEHGDGGEQHLVRVIGPPYYTLLQAIEERGSSIATRSVSEGTIATRSVSEGSIATRSVSEGSPIRAYVEAAPRVWIELGYEHPLASELKPAAGELLFVSAPNVWQGLPEVPLRDLYGALELQLPSQPAALAEIATPKLSVPLRLARGGGYETPELWVLRERALEQLEAFTSTAADQTVARLAFAVVEDGAAPLVLLRIRPGKGPPPELVFEGLACRSYLKIPNLYVPVGQRLHPPLRRDALKDLLAEDAQQIAWLTPEESGAFTPHYVREAAFRPLAEWVEYILDRDRAALTAWIRSTTFAFDDFICSEDVAAAKERAEKNPQTSSGKDSKRLAQEEEAPTTPAAPARVKRTVSKASAPRAAPEPTQLERRMTELEREFVNLKSPLDDPARLPLWEELAIVNALLLRTTDAGQCFTHVFWESDPLDHWAAVEEWLLSEVKASGLEWAPALRDLDSPRALGALHRLVNLERPLGQHGQLVAAYLVAARQVAADHFDAELLAPLARFLEKVEPLMSLRAVWLAWHALYERTKDELMLARARDRLLARLHVQGLLADLEVPVFLRGGSGSSDRYRVVRDEMIRLRETVRSWSELNRGYASSHTHDYIDLMFAFALAKLGEASRAQAMVQAASLRLRGNDPVHRWLYGAFEYRIVQVLEGQPPLGQLPERMLLELEQIERVDRYKAERLREHSRILEPHEAVNPHRNWGHMSAGSVMAELAQLPDIIDRGQLERRLRALAARPATPEENAWIVTAALELAWRMSEEFCVSMLRAAGEALVPAVGPRHQIDLLEKAILAAAHFDQQEKIPPLLARLRMWFSAEAVQGGEVLELLERALSKTFQALRKLRMRDELAALLLDASENLRGALVQTPNDPHTLRMLMALAGAGLSLGIEEGWRDIDHVREKLLTEDLGHEGHVGVQRAALLSARYFAAVGQGPLLTAIERYREYFEQTRGLKDNSIVHSHYSLKQLDVVEALITTMTSDAFTMDRSARAWLDDEEFLIRRRLHRDVRAAVEGK